MDILDELNALTQKLQERKIEYALCGGLAMAIYALPRATLDIDILIEPDFLNHTRDIAHGLGYTLEASPMEIHDGKIKIHRLTKIENGSGEAMVLDILLVTSEIRDIWKNRMTVEWEHGTISVVSPEGLILLKSFRRSGQDRDDINYLRSIIDED
jgi:hypothetical protein